MDIHAAIMNTVFLQKCWIISKLNYLTTIFNFQSMVILINLSNLLIKLDCYIQYTNSIVINFLLITFSTTKHIII